MRGRSIRHRIYNPDRLKTPLKRKEGTERGAGEWEEISWEQALDEIAQKLTELKDEYGNESFYINYGTGTLGGTVTCSWPNASSAMARLLNCWGGYLDHYGTYSTAEISAATPYQYGSGMTSNSFDDAKNSKLQVMFGNNPLETRMSGGGQTFVTQQTKKDSGVRTIVIDPRYSETALDLADEWVPLRPGTDAALVAGMIHVMISEDLHDQAFLDTYCVGFDEEHMPEGVPPNSSYRAYLEGNGSDGIEKTPEWAAQITGVPAATIRRLAREIASAKPCAITQGWGPQRHANGEWTARAIFTLANVTGNVGIPGGGTGAREGAVTVPYLPSFKTKPNPVSTKISVFTWTDAIDHGPEMTALRDGVRGKDRLDVPIKFVWQYAGNALTNQHSDINRTVELLKDTTKCELIVVSDIQHTVSARYADYLLPDSSLAEQHDYSPGENAGTMGYGIVSSQAIEPVFDTRPIYWVCSELARRLGVEQEFTEGRTQEDWVRETIESSRADFPQMPPYEEFTEMGLWRYRGESVIPLQDFREDPEANPLQTESGKIEIFSKKLYDMAQEWEFPSGLTGERLTPLPEYVATWEGVEEARENEQYPLQMIGHHYKQRTHSSYGNVDWLQEAHHQVVWIHPDDARSRGVSNDDEVEVFNDRGRIRLPARVTMRIAPGVVSVPQGAWYTTDSDGVDVGGSVNTLTSWRRSPLAKGNPQHTNLVQVAKS